MPLVLCDDEREEPPFKRRKLLSDSKMARRQKDDKLEERWEANHDDSQAAGEDIEHRNPGEPEQCIRTSSREELIECIKRGQKPTWIPTPGFQALCEQEEVLRAQRRLKLSQNMEDLQDIKDDRSHHHIIDIRNAERQVPSSSEPQNEPYERPRSALHRGDFSETDSTSGLDFWTNPDYQPGLAVSTIDTTSDLPLHWYADSPRPKSLATMSQSSTLHQLNTSFGVRRRAPSLGSSLSSSFVMRAPTSPLVYATSNPYLDNSTTDMEPEQPRLRRDSTRRRTMPPNSFHSFSMTPIDATPPNFSRPFAPALRREASMPTNTHRPQRSLTSFTYHPRSNPQTPLIRSRRPSLTSDGGSRRKTSMVGSFEESILRGRMSIPPSKPLSFVAQIGVMGKGDCPASLKCPAHVSVPFPAVFYSYPASTGIRSVADDTPSPYVGTIDLEHNLKPVILASKQNKKDATISKHEPNKLTSLDDPAASRSLTDDKIQVGGAYRIPQQGQLQIVIKNPNKTAVKLFLIPYDLSDMEVGTKTFIRQRSFSTGSIIENALAGDKPTTQAADPFENKHILRYLVHLRFCCPARNRFYLFDDIRVVFANRVPDGKEKLAVGIQLPDPKYSPWKPLKVEALQKASRSAPSTPVVTKFKFGSPQFFGDMDGFPSAESPVSPTPNQQTADYVMPFKFPKLRSRPSSPEWDTKKVGPVVEKTTLEFPDAKPMSDLIARPERTLSPVTGFAPTSPLPGSPIPWRVPSSGTHSNRSFSPVPESRDSLLSQQLKQMNGPWNRSKETDLQQMEKEDDMVHVKKQDTRSGKHFGVIRLPGFDSYADGCG